MFNVLTYILSTWSVIVCVELCTSERRQKLFQLVYKWLKLSGITSFATLVVNQESHANFNIPVLKRRYCFFCFFPNVFRQYIVITKGHCVHVFEVTSFSEHTNIYRMGKPVVGRVAVHHNRVQNKYDKL